jgi:hypothetical protein
MTWKNKQYQYYFGDFNGDELPDILLQAVTKNYPSKLLLGKIVDDQVKYLSGQAITLPDQLDNRRWHNKKATIVIFDHNGDGKSDVFVVIHSRKKAYVLNGQSTGVDFTVIEKTYGTNQFKWLQKSKQYLLYPGDFNGDNQHELLAISEENKRHYLMHAQQANGLTVVQKINHAIKWAKK